MKRKAATIVLFVLTAGLSHNAARGQAAPPTILEVATENVVEYYSDLAAASDPSKIGTNPNVTPIVAPPFFGRLVGFADIVAVNGRPAKGLVFFWELGVGASPAPGPGMPIADVATLGLRYQTFQILKTDGSPRPGVDSGKPFPASPPPVVNSPVAVMVNGERAEVLGAVGYPGAVDGYQVNFRVPPGTPNGAATVQVSAAWIAGTPVNIAVQ